MTGRALRAVGRFIGTFVITASFFLCGGWTLALGALLLVVALIEGRRQPGGWRSTGWGRLPGWYLSPQVAVARTVGFYVFLVGTSLTFWLISPLLTDDLATENDVTPEQVRALMGAVAAGYAVIALVVTAHACWQSYRGNRRALEAKANDQIERIHRVFRERSITSEHYAGVCLNGHLQARPLELGMARNCDQCRAVVTRWQAVHVVA